MNSGNSQNCQIVKGAGSCAGSRRSLSRCLRLVKGLVVCLGLWACPNGFAQKPKNSTPTPGYLNRVPPTSLRFAPPPKPPVAQLPATGITGGTAPLFNNQFFDENTATNAPHISLPLDALVGGKPNRNPGAAPQEESADTTLSNALLSPQSLVRFFDHSERIVLPPLNERLKFQPPLKGSTPSPSPASSPKHD